MSLVDRIGQQSPSVRRPLALALLLFGAILAWRTLVVPLHEVFTSQHRWRVEVTRTLAAARGRAAELPMLKRRLNVLTGAPIWQRFYREGESTNSDNALREDIARCAAAVDVTLRTIEPLPTTEQSGLKRLGVQISALMTVGQLSGFLSQIRGSPRYLRVDAIRVVAPQVQMPNRNHLLLVRMQIFGYRRPIGRGRH